MPNSTGAELGAHVAPKCRRFAGGYQSQALLNVGVQSTQYRESDLDMAGSILSLKFRVNRVAESMDFR